MLRPRRLPAVALALGLLGCGGASTVADGGSGTDGGSGSDGGVLIRIYAGPSSSSLVVNRIELCVQAE